MFKNNLSRNNFFIILQLRYNYYYNNNLFFHKCSEQRYSDQTVQVNELVWSQQEPFK